jgi:hypothetical protein
MSASAVALLIFRGFFAVRWGAQIAASGGKVHAGACDLVAASIGHVFFMIKPVSPPAIDRRPA